MKKNNLSILLLIIGSSTILRAQWDTVTQFNQVIEDLKTFNNELFIAGGFTKNQGSTCYWSASYDGNFIVPQTNLIGGSGIRAMEVFGTDMYSADALDHGGVMGVGIWNGSTWQNGGSTNYSHSVIYADGNDLYVESDDGKIRKKTGSGSFQPFYDFAGSGSISSIIRYNNNLIFCGSFTTINGVAANHIVQWDGTNWQPLGTGISTGAYLMAVYNNELYVAGNITSAGGITVTNIAKWNGSVWSDVGGGVTGYTYNGIRDMKSTASGLLVVGAFTQMGQVITSNVALWNGSQWIGLDLNHTDDFVNCVEVYNNKIYVGTFDFNHSHLFRYNGPLLTVDAINSDNIAIYPNPTKNKITIEIPTTMGETILSIYNMTGQEFIEKKIKGTYEQVDISNLPLGVYFLSLQMGSDKIVKKIVKE